MPNFLSAEAGEPSTTRSRSRQRARTDADGHRSMWDPLKKIGSWLRREEEEPPPPAVKLDKHIATEEENKENGRPHSSGEHHGRVSGLLGRRTSRKVVPGLPRPLTFKRQNSEKREKLLPVPVEPDQRRAASADRRSSQLAPKRTLSPPPVSVPSMSAPDVLSPHTSEPIQKPGPIIGGGPDSNIPAGARQVDYDPNASVERFSAGEPRPQSIADDAYFERASQRSASDVDEVLLQEELEAKWILNLSMHFRDMSDREKFFITYAEEPNKWRRVTVSCDYRELTPDSLEHDLKSLHYQRDKSSRIYEAIRDSLPDIQFYDTVTNLKLQTADGRLHVHVTEDVNEIIPYPSVSAVDHLDCKKFRESNIDFDSHISGFVYKISTGHKTYIKKEIPGPDAVEEFLYEINALCALVDSKSVIKFEGIIVDEDNGLIKGLLISYAEQGALVDLLYDFKGGNQMNWPRRQRWARQIVQGLSEIHEAGFVQGDFTLSNIVIDGKDDAKIIDINRRGCPVGWEPPELAKLIESGQRISIYIGVKSDIFQLGMVLWALAEEEDEPERQERPLYQVLDPHNDVPQYFRDVIKACLSEVPRQRPSAKNVLAMLPDETTLQEEYIIDKQHVQSALEFQREESPKRPYSQSSFSSVHMPSTEYIDSTASYAPAASTRGRSTSHPSNGRSRRPDYSPYHGHPSIMSLDDSELENEPASIPGSRETRWEQVYVDGDTQLVQRTSLAMAVHDYANPECEEISGDMDSSFGNSKTADDVKPLNFSTVDELQPPSQSQELSPSLDSGNGMDGAEAGHRRYPSNKASFSDRVHHLNQIQTSDFEPKMKRTNTLADLENEVGMDSSIASSTAPSRVNTAFSFAGSFAHPLHQDSGFNEPEARVSYESERIRHSLDLNKFDVSFPIQERVIEGRLWDEKDGNMIDDRMQESQPVTEVGPGPQLVHVSNPRISEEIANEKDLEEKTSNNTIRPPSLTIPRFAHNVPECVDSGIPEQKKDDTAHGLRHIYPHLSPTTSHR